MNEVPQFVELDDLGFQTVLKDRDIYHQFMDALSCIHDLVAEHPRFALAYIENAIKKLLESNLPDTVRENIRANYETAMTLHGLLPEENTKVFVDSLSRFYTGLRMVEKDW